MDIVLKHAWAAALRSGKFQQGTSMLYNAAENSYCCLGVLCKLQGAVWQDYENGKPTDSDDFYEYTHVPVLDGKLVSAHGDELINSEFREVWGLTQAQQNALVNRNDGYMFGCDDEILQINFSRIADFIESPEFENLE